MAKSLYYWSMEQQAVIDKFQAFVAVEGDTLLRLLAWAEQAVAQQILAGLAERGYANVSLAELRLMQQLCLSGTRSTELAARLKLSKQAIGQLIDGLEKKGWVVRSQDPSDRRAKRITYTAQGYQFISDAIDATLVAEHSFSQLIGADNYQRLKKSLMQIVSVMMYSPQASALI